MNVSIIRNVLFEQWDLIHIIITTDESGAGLVLLNLNNYAIVLSGIYYIKYTDMFHIKMINHSLTK